MNIEKEIKRILEISFWLPTLKTDTLYERTHDDHDGTFKGKIRVAFDMMGDAWVNVDRQGIDLRFRSWTGGGNSQRVRNALMILAEAIRLDNEEHPEPEPNQLKQLSEARDICTDPMNCKRCKAFDQSEYKHAGIPIVPQCESNKNDR